MTIFNNSNVIMGIDGVFFFQAEDGIRDGHVTGVQTCALPISALRGQPTRAAGRLATTLDHLLPRIRRVIGQTTRRVLHGEAVPAQDKLVSLFEPHTAIIRKDKLPGHTSFGRMVWLDEVDGGIISRYGVLDGNPPEEEQLRPSLDHHLALFQRPPALLA